MAKKGFASIGALVLWLAIPAATSAQPVPYRHVEQNPYAVMHGTAFKPDPFFDGVQEIIIWVNGSFYPSVPVIDSQEAQQKLSAAQNTLAQAMHKHFDSLLSAEKSKTIKTHLHQAYNAPPPDVKNSHTLVLDIKVHSERKMVNGKEVTLGTMRSDIFRMAVTAQPEKNHLLKQPVVTEFTRLYHPFYSTQNTSLIYVIEDNDTESESLQRALDISMALSAEWINGPETPQVP